MESGLTAHLAQKNCVGHAAYSHVSSNEGTSGLHSFLVNSCDTVVFQTYVEAPIHRKEMFNTWDAIFQSHLTLRIILEAHSLIDKKERQKTKAKSSTSGHVENLSRVALYCCLNLLPFLTPPTLQKGARSPQTVMTYYIPMRPSFGNPQYHILLRLPCCSKKILLPSPQCLQSTCLQEQLWKSQEKWGMLDA